MPVDVHHQPFGFSSIYLEAVLVHIAISEIEREVICNSTS